MGKTSFLIFLRKRQHRKDLVGFFAREWLADNRNGKPTGTKGVQSVIDYMIAQGATESAILAAQKAHEEWRELSRVVENKD